MLRAQDCLLSRVSLLYTPHYLGNVGRYMKLCHTREELARLPQGPKLVLATLPSLQAGMARDLFMEWAPHPKNLILFTQQAEVMATPHYAHNTSITLSCLLTAQRECGVNSDQFIMLWACLCGQRMGVLHPGVADQSAGCTIETVLSQHVPCLEEQDSCLSTHATLTCSGAFMPCKCSCMQWTALAKGYPSSASRHNTA